MLCIVNYGIASLGQIPQNSQFFSKSGFVQLSGQSYLACLFPGSRRESPNLLPA